MTIYFIQEQGTQYIKIGYTDNSVKERLNALQTGNPRPLVVVKSINGSRSEEVRLHQKFKHCQVRKEWFILVPELWDYIDGASAKISSKDILDKRFLGEVLKKRVPMIFEDKSHNDPNGDPYAEVWLDDLDEWERS